MYNIFQSDNQVRIVQKGTAHVIMAIRSQKAGALSCPSAVVPDEGESRSAELGKLRPLSSGPGTGQGVTGRA